MKPAADTTTAEIITAATTTTAVAVEGRKHAATEKAISDSTLISRPMEVIATTKVAHTPTASSNVIATRENVEEIKITSNNAIVTKEKDMEKVVEITREIRNYSMDVCKQMKKKLLYIDRKHFSIRNDKGSTAHEQLYIDCSTAVYKYFKFYL